MAKESNILQLIIDGLEWVGRLGIWWLTWPFKYFTIKRVIFAVICIAVGVGLVGVGLISIADKRCIMVEGQEACFLIFPIEVTVANLIK